MMAHTESTEDAVDRKVRAWILDQRKAGRTQQAIAADLKVSRTTIVDIIKGSKSAGSKVQNAFADLLYKGSKDAMERDATGSSAVATVPRFELDLSRFDLTEEEMVAVEFALKVEKIPAKAIVETLETSYKSSDRLSAQDLVDAFKITHRKLIRRGGEAESREELPDFEAIKKG